jgi:hypothetical protein
MSANLDEVLTYSRTALSKALSNTGKELNR